MTLHLTAEQICQSIAGDLGSEVEQHLRDCPACQAECDQFQNAVAGFRDSLEQSPVPAVNYSRVRQTLPRWILATATLSLLVAAPVYWNARQQRVADQAQADELLLERVHTGLSRAVPASMEPLMQFRPDGKVDAGPLREIFHLETAATKPKTKPKSSRPTSSSTTPPVAWRSTKC